MTTMEAIRLRYPHPERCPDVHNHLATRVYVYNAYCVGGAVCRAAFPTTVANFPTSKTIVTALRTLNPALSISAACRAALDLMAHNDHEEFEAAWQIVALALSVGNPEGRLV